ncbi:alpha/beta hydrolase [Phenylobacterium sp. LH3H17]|uniref:alpha/beta fold hydrolase n=1 Tax=Phenylobacterium sp. LH3H17 TaxID=2903901 RepID=UPI0020C98542|nr:alpha/beta hydrolase [Phenylobacterium sp. LH3H17]UTP41348.1 alpha/beta hydrolase [Phenylobacterium sp. LH3H17]
MSKFPRGLGRAIMALAASCTLTTAAAADERMLPVTPEVSLRVIDEGPRNARPPVVLITGWGFTADIWRDQAQRLARTRRVVSFDPRSQGRSTVTAQGMTPSQRARDLDALLTQLGLEEVYLVGWSQGVQDVAAYVDGFGTRKLAGAVLVDAAVSSGSGAVLSDPQTAARTLRLLSIYAAQPEAYARGMLGAIISRPLDKAQTDRLAADIAAVPTAIGSAALVADLYGADLTPALKKLDRPTLIVASASSPELQAQRDGLKLLPDGRIEVVENAAHTVFIDQPDRFAQILERFLADADAATS